MTWRDNLRLTRRAFLALPALPVLGVLAARPRAAAAAAIPATVVTPEWLAWAQEDITARLTARERVVKRVLVVPRPGFDTTVRFRETS